MKKKLHLLYKVCFCLSALMLTGCKDDPHDDLPDLSGDISQYVPEYSCTLHTSFSKSGENVSFSAYVEPYADLAKWGLRINKVTYMLDGEMLATVNVAPYSYNYGPEKWVPGKHILQALVYITGVNCDPLILTLEKDLSTGSAADSDSDRAAADINWIYNYVGEGDTFEMEIYLNSERSSAGLTINSASATLGGKELGIRSSSPYTFRSLITEPAGTNLPLSAEVKYSYKGQTYTTSYGFSGFTVMASDASALRFQLLSTFGDYRNGERLRGIANPYIGKDITDYYELNLYIDDVLIETLRTFPSEMDYLLHDLEAGEHELIIEWVAYTAEGVKKFTSSRPQSFYIN